MAPLIRKMRIIIDKDVEISIPGAPKGLHEEFLTKQLGSIKSKERLATLAEDLREALPPGAFPFAIGFETDMRVGNDRTFVDPEYVTLAAAGIVMESTTSWRHPFQRFEGRLRMLDELAPETLDKTPWFLVRIPEAQEPQPAPMMIHASNETAARLKGMMAMAPTTAEKIMSGRGYALNEYDVARLSALHVSPAGAPLIDMVRDFDPAPEPT